MNSDHLLSLLLGVPALGAFVVFFMPRQWARALRLTSVGFMLAELGLSFSLLSADYTDGGYHFVEKVSWIETWGISYHLGVDGISLWLVLLTTLLTPIALFVSWTSITTKVKEYALSFLLLELAMLGAFISLDVFLFYVFWELMLVPMYFIIGVWGGPERVYAAVKFFIYTMVGSLLMLVAILYLVGAYHEASGHYSFDLLELRHLIIPRATQIWLFLAFILAFAIKVPMFPFHTWLPDAHTQAPTGGSVILAAVMLKLGTYGFLRFAMPLFPLASQLIGPTIALFAIIGIIYGAWAAWVQKDAKKLVAYSSVSHMGFIALGLFSMTNHGVNGSLLQMLNHGVSTGALFILVGVIYERRHTRLFSEFGGLAKVMPWYALFFVVVSLSSIGLPGTNGFVGEFMILVGTFTSNAEVGFGPWGRVFTLFAATGVIFAAVYMLHAVLEIFWGPITHKANETLKDLTFREVAALLPLMALIFWIGLYPATFLDRSEDAVNGFVQDFNAKYEASKSDDSLRLWGEPEAPADAPPADAVAQGDDAPSVAAAAAGGAR
ncbi:MAG: NADH-quinone oxidoreductase subunit M [Myxococcales bacterium]|nr:NADH-quinone oxidoreductase subunit M [Myxococcales bacterium]